MRVLSQQIVSQLNQVVVLGAESEVSRLDEVLLVRLQFWAHRLEIDDEILEQHLILKEEVYHLVLVLSYVASIQLEVNLGLDAQDLVILFQDLLHQRHVFKI